ncbi:hypothetical protein [Jeongeupia sp. USM3]|uniref:hypothetical protein n=1 Tax=Jeongeupia sp. USM3 TaxID=1906741 RepID=UPI0011AB2D7F|nr:hypothetical protein [Jeongeupia sp. USM3]
MSRHHRNPNLTLHIDPHFRGLPVQQDKGPFIYDYLDRLQDVVVNALSVGFRLIGFQSAAGHSSRHARFCVP